MSSVAVGCSLSPLLPRPRSAVAVAGCKSRSIRIRASMTSPPPPVAEFPYLPPAQRDLMVEVHSMVETGLGPQLLPSTVPSDVLSFQNPSGSAHGALDIRYGDRDSTFIQGSPTSLVLLLDLIPRKDVVLHPDYLHEFYHQTHLDKHRQLLDKLPQVQPSTVNIDCGHDGNEQEQTVMEEIIRGKLNMICKEIVQIWLHLCVKTRPSSEVDRDILVERDSLIKSKTMEIDLEPNLPRMFTPEVASRVVREIKKAYKV